MKEGELFLGLILLGIAAYLFLFLDSSFSIPLAITLTVIGFFLIAISRRREQF